ncbi:MAG: hypothetical protein RL637_1491 [Pseudomonadota bacterium]|jgi:hypothetical protein
MMQNFKQQFSAISLAVCGCLGLIATMNVQADSSKMLWKDNGHYYQRFDKSYILWADAKSNCEKIGGYLATITSDGEQAFIEANVANNLWNYIGASYASGKWQWVTGEAWNYEHWSSS